eukprot:CAMPEP_0181333498 /NCGR_PEP_ID=MMETSP1101-20121128/25710_1 /TAXON_ID=46948 /ORGANISM="Rhodomonas abbreviata, Strain Caron Lab Isolate" /LENGTH=62 /DNA_ID=CAMNT_0023443315 /DNA_START=1 /DNA_END=185 /DNA_ORIENTATION=+
MFDKDAETLEFIADFFPTWEVDAASSTISLTGASTDSKSEEIPSLRVISQNLSYATEMERIV